MEAGGAGEHIASMSDGARIRYWVDGATTAAVPIVLLHGGPGLPDYLSDVAALVADLTTVYRFDQRGTGGSSWTGRHTLARHVTDLSELLDHWQVPRAVLAGHSYGTELACRFVLAHPERVAGSILLAGPFTGDWRDDDRAARHRRMTRAQRHRHELLESIPQRSEEQETELLTLSWFPDHADTASAWELARRAALVRRPVNWGMNRELGAQSRADPIERHLPQLRRHLAGRAELLGGVEDPRPARALRRLASELDVPLTLVEDAGHEPWHEQPAAVRRHLRRMTRRAGCGWPPP